MYIFYEYLNIEKITEHYTTGCEHVTRDRGCGEGERQISKNEDCT